MAYLWRMQSIKWGIKQRWNYLLLVLNAILLFGIIIFWMGNLPLYKSISGWHSREADVFFRYATHGGDGLFVLVVAGGLAMARRFRTTLAVVVSYLCTGAVAQLVKAAVASPRPRAVLEAAGEKLRAIEGIEAHLHHSFPSGHTTTAFALAVCLIMMSRPGVHHILFVMFAAIVGYSRIYLSQHFPLDVWAGMIIGSVLSLLVCLYIWQRWPLPYVEAETKPIQSTDISSGES